MRFSSRVSKVEQPHQVDGDGGSPGRSAPCHDHSKINMENNIEKRPGESGDFQLL
jgi:hypothetical protein